MLLSLKLFQAVLRTKIMILTLDSPFDGIIDGDESTTYGVFYHRFTAKLLVLGFVRGLAYG